ncbi:MAG: NusG domain II-containing protein [Clostridia bacterium]|nr:NusG domain II-containing protein [Clostridia bacterium]
MILILVLVLAAVGALTGYLLSRRGVRATNEVAIYIDGALYTTAPVQEGKTLTIDQGNGEVNVIRFLADGFYMESSTCDNQLCVLQGEVTQENWKSRLLQNEVLCLPHRLEVMLVVEKEGQDLPDI